MSDRTVEIAARFQGPPQSANGGYVCGLIADAIEGAAEVTLLKPPPLDTPLTLQSAGGEEVRLLSDGELIGVGTPTTVATSPLPSPGAEAAKAAADRTFDASRHPFPRCFVCGPLRDHGDGLCIQPGPVDPDDSDWVGQLAAPWTPGTDFADGAGLLRAEFLWAALDCPTAYATSSPAGMRAILLGRQAVAIHRRPDVGQPLVVTAILTGQDGRKFFANSALFDTGGELLAECRATWIELKPEARVGIGA